MSLPDIKKKALEKELGFPNLTLPELEKLFYKSLLDGEGQEAEDLTELKNELASLRILYEALAENQTYDNTLLLSKIDAIHTRLEALEGL